MIIWECTSVMYRSLAGLVVASSGPSPSQKRPLVARGRNGASSGSLAGPLLVQDATGSGPSSDRNKTRERPGLFPVPPRPERDQRKPTCGPVRDLGETFNGPYRGDALLVFVICPDSGLLPVPTRATAGPYVDLDKAASGIGSGLRVPACAQLLAVLRSIRRQVRSAQQLGGAGPEGPSEARSDELGGAERSRIPRRARSAMDQDPDDDDRACEVICRTDQTGPRRCCQGVRVGPRLG